jgi:hypothetical protein
MEVVVLSCLGKRSIDDLLNDINRLVNIANDNTTYGHWIELNGNTETFTKEYWSQWGEEPPKETNWREDYKKFKNKD